MHHKILPRCLDEVVDEDEDDVVLFPFPVSRPNLAAAAAMTACDAAEAAAASLKMAEGSNWYSNFWGSGLEVELKDSEDPDELLVGNGGLIDLGAAVGGTIWGLIGGSSL